MARIERHTVGLANGSPAACAPGLGVLTPVNNQLSIVAFRNPASAATTRAMLEGARCRVSVRENGPQIRVSAALFNTLGDVRRLLDLVGELQKSR